MLRGYIIMPIIIILILTIIPQQSAQTPPNCVASSTIGWAVRPGVGASTQSCTVCSVPYTLRIIYVVTNYLTLVSHNIYRCTNCTVDCLTCTATASNCLTCDPGKYLDGTTCYSCTALSSNCVSCTSASCQSCSYPYSLNASDLCWLDCVSLYGAGCATCNTYNCFSCSPTFALNSLTPIGCTLCTNLTQCQNCINGPECTLCNTGFYLDFANSSRSCVACTFTNCVSCIDGPICTDCTTGFGLDVTLTVPTCVACSSIPNCLSCLTGPECTECSGSLVPTNSTVWNQCVSCSPTEYSYMNLCFSCPYYCTGCYQSVTGDIICIGCSTGSIMNSANNHCKRCDTAINHCAECSDLSTCTKCQFPTLLTSAKDCNQCQSGYNLIDGFCTNLVGCQVFSPDYSKCLVCYANYHFYYEPKSQKCVCSKGYYQSSTYGFVQCFSKCGDGILIVSDEDCDDGNLRDEDGCNDKCQEQANFSCTTQSPSQCTLKYAPLKFQFNYAYKYQGKNRCKFSLSLAPSRPSFKYIKWSNYLSMNISEGFIVKNSKIFTYQQSSSELSVEFEYSSRIQNLMVEIKLFSRLINPLVKQAYTKEQIQIKQVLTQNDAVSQAVASTQSNMFSGLELPDQISLIVDLNGINSKLIHEDDNVLNAYQSASIASLIITILVLIQFVIGSYFHKMIGLETIQILQFFYFIRIIIQQHLSTFLNSMNVFKYVAYGGYSNYQSIFGQQSQQSQLLTYLTVQQNFIQFGLMKYFLTNVNISLTIPALILIFFIFSMVRKYLKRSQYLKSLDQSVKDQYTTVRRSSQWIYDHFLFPYFSIFSMIIFFSTVLYLQSSLKSESELQYSSTIKIIETTSFSAHLTIAFITFLIFCSEFFSSWQNFQHSRLTQKEKARVPKSIYQKLEHDENNPDRPNYKPGYIMIYLIFYLLVEIVLMLDILSSSLKDLGLEIMMVLSFVYLTFVWKWNPYHQAVDFHNKILKLNHLVVFLFMAMSVISQRIQISTVLYVVLIYVFLFLLVVVALCGYMRIIVEYRFRKKLLQNSNLMDLKRKIGKSKNPTNDDKRQALLRHNKFAFENIMSKWMIQKGYFNQQHLNENQIDQIKQEIRQQLYEANRLARSREEDASHFHTQIFRANVQNKPEKPANMIKNGKNEHKNSCQVKWEQMPTKPVNESNKERENQLSLQSQKNRKRMINE